jgi:uncharacterized protein (TIGR00661 family)
MGHAMRSRVVLEHLAERSHRVLVVVSGRAHAFLRDHFAGVPGIEVREIHGFSLVTEGNAVDRSESVKLNLEQAPQGLAKNIEAYRAVVEAGFAPEAVVSDFESWSYLYGRRYRLPTVSIDNMQIINRCRHEADVTDGRSLDFRLAKLAVKLKLAGAYHYLITSFFFPPVRKPRTTLVAPILRPEVVRAARAPGSHVLVYQTSAVNAGLLPVLKASPYEFRVYGMKRDDTDGNLRFRPFSQTGFLDDLRSARAVIATAGFTLMSEAVHLRVPLLAVPLEAQYEQELNARYLARLGYGGCAHELTPAVVERFIESSPAHERALAGYPSQDNSVLYACLDELLERIAAGERAPERLATPAMGGYEPRRRR